MKKIDSKAGERLHKYIIKENTQMGCMYIQDGQYQYSSEKNKLKPQFTITIMAHILLLRKKNDIVILEYIPGSA